MENRGRFAVLESLLDKFIYSPTVKTRQNALTSVDAVVEEATEAELSRGQPWDRTALLQRLLTYKPGTWFGKPTQISQVVCAAHGWINVGTDTLKCPSCKAVIAFTTNCVLHGRDGDAAANAFLRDLEVKHSRICTWRDKHDAKLELLAFPRAPPDSICATFCERVTGLCALDALPFLGGRGLATITKEHLPQLLALLSCSTVPVTLEAPRSDNGEQQSDIGDQQRNMLAALSRRQNAFVQGCKVLALLGWTLEPLPNSKPDEGGLHSIDSSMLRCKTCAAAVGLWTHPTAETTAGTLGCGGLLGSWGPGCPQPNNSLKTLSIAGGLEHQAVSMAQLDPTRSGSQLPTFGSTASNASVPSFGSAAAAPAFGASVTLAANAAPRHVAAPTIGRKRSREEAITAAENARKAAKIVAAMVDDALPESVEAKLTKAGLVISKEKAFDPVDCHRAWCPWVFPASRAGWKQVLGAVAPADSVAPEKQAASSEEQEMAARSSPAKHSVARARASIGGEAPPPSILSTANKFLSRLSRRSAPARTDL